VIDEFAAKHNVDLVVMGHQGVTGLAFMGGNTTAVIKQCNVPVLAVPDTALEGPVRRIVLLSDHGELLPGVLAPLRDIALRTGAEVSITHVSEEASHPCGIGATQCSNFNSRTSTSASGSSLAPMCWR